MVKAKQELVLNLKMKDKNFIIHLFNFYLLREIKQLLMGSCHFSHHVFVPKTFKLSFAHELFKSPTWILWVSQINDVLNSRKEVFDVIDV